MRLLQQRLRDLLLRGFVKSPGPSPFHPARAVDLKKSRSSRHTHRTGVRRSGLRTGDSRFIQPLLRLVPRLRQDGNDVHLVLNLGNRLLVKRKAVLAEVTLSRDNYRQCVLVLWELHSRQANRGSHQRCWAGQLGRGGFMKDATARGNYDEDCHSNDDREVRGPVEVFENKT